VSDLATVRLMDNKLVYIICDQGVEPDVMEVIKARGHEHYTRWGECQGSGETGLREGTPVWPGLNAVILLVIEAPEVEPLVSQLHEMRDSFPMTPGLKLIVTDGILI